MVGYEEALAAAKKLKSFIDTCDEYTNAYVFKSEADRFSIGGDGPCCILKKDGRAVNFTEYIDVYAGEFIKTITVPSDK